MEADSVKACHLAYCVPRPLEVRARLSCFFAGYDVRIAVNPGQGGQDRCSRSRKIDRLYAGLAVGQKDHAAVEIDMLPFGIEDFAHSCAGQHQQSNRRECMAIDLSPPVLRLWSVLRFGIR